jgi:pSer/pThr/pTyr-binding forkhead associated (FHA) protein
MILASTSYETVLLALKIAFLVLLYLFVWRIVRTAKRELQAPQESFILTPAVAARAGLLQPHELGRLVVSESPSLRRGEAFSLGATPVTAGRGGQNEVVLDGDDFASARHVRFEPRRDGVWVRDLGSTNGTFVNGAQIDGPRRLAPGDVVRVGATELRYEE